MPPRLNLARTKVCDETLETPDCVEGQIIVKGDTATVRDGSAVIRTADGVQAVERVSRTDWIIRFADGSMWLVNRTGGGCGCH
jgi:hypothetical protein